MKRVLFFFVRWPEPGSVKTRLAASIGDKDAANLYQVMAEDQFESLREGMRESVYQLWIYGTPVERLGRIAFWLNDGKQPIVDVLPQPAGSLDARLEHAMELGFKALGADEVYFAGSDCPEISSDLVSQAATILESTDTAMGRAADGGFYLLGLSKYLPGVFEGVRFSAASTADELLQSIAGCGASYEDGSLPVLNDADELSDLREMPKPVIKRLKDQASLRQIHIDALEEL